MTAPIRSMPELVNGIRTARDEREVTHEVIDNISGVQSGYTSKVLAGIKNPGPVSLFPLLGALGKALVIVDDPEQIKLVEGRWQKRKRPQKAQMLKAASSIIEKMDLSPEIKQQLMKEYMQKLGQMGGKKGGSKGGKRRAKLMSKRARQRVATHAARMRWSKRHA